MDNLSEIIKKRTTPGILIFDMGERLLFSNAEALELLPIASQGVPDEVRNICRQARESSCAAGMAPGGHDYALSLRAFPIGDHGGADGATHIMVLVERITGKRSVDLDTARERFGLSNREVELLGLVCQGLTNKAISERLFISEHTVKDHIKNIMKKMGVGSRSEIVAALK